jgi:hypothetical protein
LFFGESTLFQQLGARCTPSTLALLCALAVALAPTAGATAARSRPAAGGDPASSFSTLAQQRPWICAEQQSAGLPRTGWTAGAAECAWQNRLRVRRWSGRGGVEQGACVSAQARWWAWARGPGPAAAGAPLAWRTTWASQRVIDERGAEQRIVILRRLPKDEWSVTEWRWNPSPRGATRRWQEGRWKLLLARAEQFGAAAEAAPGPAEARALRGVLESNLGARVGEVGGQGWRWQGDGLCFRVDAAGLGQQLMQLPYAVDDSRLEQRAAMQLQLARRYPKATWLTGFTLVPAAPHGRGGAKFYAMWIEGATLKGQLWIPTKGDGPSVRLRIVTELPAAPDGRAAAPALARAEPLLRRELTGLASRWAVEHE